MLRDAPPTYLQYFPSCVARRLRSHHHVGLVGSFAVMSVSQTVAMVTAVFRCNVAFLLVTFTEAEPVASSRRAGFP